MKNSKVNYPQYINELSMTQKFILLSRALNIYYGKRILIMMEYTAQKWCKKLGIPVFGMRLVFEGLGNKVAVLYIGYRVGTGLQEVGCRINLR